MLFIAGMPQIHPYTVEEHGGLAAQLRLAEAGLSGLVRKLDSDKHRIRRSLIEKARKLEGTIAGLRLDFQAECNRLHPGLPMAADPYRSV